MSRGAASLGLLLVGLVGSVSAAPPGLKKVHVLMVLDNNDIRLRQSLQVDELRLQWLWQSILPRDSCTVKILKGNNVTREKILEHCRKLPSGPQVSLVFYYAGHGEFDVRTQQHLFSLNLGKPLFRREVIQTLEARRAGLVVVLTDCCSTARRSTRTAIIPGKSRELFVTEPRAAGSRVARHLFFESRGTIDITAADRTQSWGDNLRGGLFTRVLCEQLRRPAHELDTSRDGFVSWQEVFPRLRDQTMELFGKWRKTIPRGDDIPQQTQRPVAFSLGRRVGGEAPARHYAVVGLKNQTRQTVTYLYRWADGEEWTEATLKPGAVRTHYCPLPDGRTDLPVLQTRFGSPAQEATFAARAWSGTGRPTFAAASQYSIQTRKQAP